jgi:precorrin-3B C17-methyltransferase
MLFIVGIGPGSKDYLTGRAIEILESVDTVVGYTTYVELIRPLLHDKHIVSTPMTQEVERVQCAIEFAQKGIPCAIVSGGDPGIYAMAGLVLETCKKNRIPIAPSSAVSGKSGGAAVLHIEVVPGVPALCAGASLIGAPLTHDFAVISLSDLLTPWPVIEKRLQAAAEADFVIVLYNPKSKRRSRQLEKAQEILLQYRCKHTPVGIATRAMRDGESVRIVSLEHLHTVPVDMQTTVFIGNSTSAAYSGFMVTPRGYAAKYALARSED